METSVASQVERQKHFAAQVVNKGMIKVSQVLRDGADTVSIGAEYYCRRVGVSSVYWRRKKTLFMTVGAAKIFCEKLPKIYFTTCCQQTRVWF